MLVRGHWRRRSQFPQYTRKLEERKLLKVYLGVIRARKFLIENREAIRKKVKEFVAEHEAKEIGKFVVKQCGSALIEVALTSIVLPQIAPMIYGTTMLTQSQKQFLLKFAREVLDL